MSHDQFTAALILFRSYNLFVMPWHRFMLFLVLCQAIKYRYNRIILFAQRFFPVNFPLSFLLHFVFHQLNNLLFDSLARKYYSHYGKYCSKYSYRLNSTTIGFFITMWLCQWNELQSFKPFSVVIRLIVRP